jgi:hypothetical protein
VGTNDLSSRFGEALAVYRPSRGQTFAGVFVSGGAASVCFAIAAFATGLDATNRVCGAILGGVVAWLGVWLYWQGRWRLAVFADGVVQVRPGRVDEIRWTDVTEIVRTKQNGFGERTVRVTLITPGGHIPISPVNFRSRAEMFERLVIAAQEREIPVRVEWEEVD